MIELISLEEHKRRFDETLVQYKTRIIVCAGTGCLAGGSLHVHDRFLEAIAAKNLPVAVSLKKEPADYLLSAAGVRDFAKWAPW